MKATLRDKTWHPRDVEAATDDYCNTRLQHAWIRRGMFQSEIREPRPSYPRAYPLAGVYEAALLSYASLCGLPLSIMKSCIATRCKLAAGLPAEAMWEGDMGEAIVGLPEFSASPDAEDWYWLIYIATGWVPGLPASDAPGPFIQHLNAVQGKRAGAEALAEALYETLSEAVTLTHVLNVSKLVSLVDKRLSERLEAQPAHD